MQFRTVIKILHCITTVCLLTLVGGFILLNQQDDTPDTLKTTSQINSNHWLYMTEHNKGGATVPITYRYYIHAKIDGSDSEIEKELNKLEPLISGMGNITNIRIDKDEHINVTYSGRVLSLADDVDLLTFQIKQ